MVTSELAVVTNEARVTVVAIAICDKSRLPATIPSVQYRWLIRSYHTWLIRSHDTWIIRSHDTWIIRSHDTWLTRSHDLYCNLLKAKTRTELFGWHGDMILSEMNKSLITFWTHKASPLDISTVTKQPVSLKYCRNGVTNFW